MEVKMKVNIKTPITYYGGKQSILKHILPLVPPHKRYTEAFLGGAALFFAKEPAPSEVINDLDGNLIQFYRVAQTNYPALKERIDATLHSRDTHTQAGHILSYPCFYEPVDIAWAIWVRSKQSFASRLDGAFGYDFSGGMPKRVRNAKDAFTEAICDRLQKVTIESRDALQVLECYDSPDAFHFIDPPYLNSNCGHYEGLFGESHLDALLALMVELKGKWMLTMFPYDKIQAYATKHGWTIHRITRTISASKKKRRQQEEWLVTNY